LGSNVAIPAPADVPKNALLDNTGLRHLVIGLGSNVEELLLFFTTGERRIGK
jgi:hypothetical protein